SFAQRTADGEYESLHAGRRTIYIEDDAQGKQRNHVIRHGGRDDLLADIGLKLAEVHEDADAHGQRRDGDAKSYKDGSCVVEPKGAAHHNSEKERYDKS